MQAFHEWFVHELEQRQNTIDNPCPIEVEVNESGTVLGTLPDNLKPLFFLMLDLIDERNESATALHDWIVEHPGFHPAHPEDAKPELIGEFQEKKINHRVACDKLKTITSYFWSSIHHIFPDSHNHNKMEVCKDWQIVCGDDEGDIKIDIIGIGGIPSDFVGGSTVDPFGDLLGSFFRRGH
ncbi:hypothetical protein H6761_01875 [Candidatus Nomurabacteria bacterium]|nr:hypothetical protein [Candidatus Nomurabacteria bacterium]